MEQKVYQLRLILFGLAPLIQPHQISGGPLHSVVHNPKRIISLISRGKRTKATMAVWIVFRPSLGMLIMLITYGHAAPIFIQCPVVIFSGNGKKDPVVKQLA